MKIKVLNKAFRRLYRIAVFKRGIYGKYGKRNRFCKDVYMNERTTVGSYNYFGERVVLFNAVIGNYCSIANSVKIGELSHDIECVSTSTYIFNPKYEISNYTGIEKPAIIEDDVWIGSNAVIMQGITIHHGAVVGAGAIVTKDVPAYAIVAGVPAKVIRYRFNENDIKIIEESNWWDSDLKEARIKCKELQRRLNKSR